MADKKITLERSYNVPLRKGWLKAPIYKRTNKAIKTLREFLQKHMKSDQIRLGMHLNEHLWKDGIRNPPHHVKVNVTKDAEGIVKAELEGFDFKEAIKAKPKEEKATGLKGKLQDALAKTESKGSESDKKESKPAKETEDKEEEKVKEEKTVPKAEAKSAKAEVKKEKKPKTATSKKKSSESKK